MELASSGIPLLLSASHFVLFSLVHSAVVYCHKPPNTFPSWILVFMSASYYLLLSLLREAKLLVLSPQLLLFLPIPFFHLLRIPSLGVLWSLFLCYQCFPLYWIIFICRQVCYFSLSKFSVVFLLLLFSMLFSGTFLAGSRVGKCPWSQCLD